MTRSAQASEKEPHEPKAKDNKADFLFVQSATGVTYADGKLTFAGVNPATVMFSDRPERIASVLGRQTAVPSAELATALGISVPTLHRLLGASTLPILVAGRLRPAPVYDILPMRHAPLRGGELPAPEWTPPLPLPCERDTWLTASQVALTFWERVAADVRIGAGFRDLGSRHGRAFRDLAEQV